MRGRDAVPVQHFRFYLRRHDRIAFVVYTKLLLPEIELRTPRHDHRARAARLRLELRQGAEFLLEIHRFQHFVTSIFVAFLEEALLVRGTGQVVGGGGRLRRGRRLVHVLIQLMRRVAAVRGRSSLLVGVR